MLARRPERDRLAVGREGRTDRDVLSLLVQQPLRVGLRHMPHVEVVAGNVRDPVAAARDVEHLSSSRAELRIAKRNGKSIDDRRWRSLQSPCDGCAGGARHESGDRHHGSGFPEGSARPGSRGDDGTGAR